MKHFPFNRCCPLTAFVCSESGVGINRYEQHNLKASYYLILVIFTFESNSYRIFFYLPP